MSAMCKVNGLRSGEICITPQAAQELVKEGVLTPLDGYIGVFIVVEDMEDRFWRWMRKVW